MTMLKCPFCYVPIDGRKLWFRCTGRGSPGRTGCVPQVDEARRRATGNQELVLPSFPPPGRGLRGTNQATCEACGAPTGIRVCPNCHTRMPATFGDERSPLIAMVGAKGTGKTVYLGTLTNQLRRELGGRFQADVRPEGDGQFAANANGGISFASARGPFGEGTLVEETKQAQAGRREPVVFAWRRKQAFGYGTTFLSFVDTAGEDLMSQESVDDLRYLGAADALILLLDPFMIPEARDRIHLPPEAIRSEVDAVDVVNRVTDSLRISHRLRNRKNIPIPVAVVFAKIDAFFALLGPDNPLVRQPDPGPYYDEVAGRATHEYVRALLYDWGAGAIDTHLAFNYKTFRYFAVSALGAEPDYANNRINAHGLRPFRVDEPLLWLLSRAGVVPTGGVPR
jgi:hypothetical protein